MPTRRGQTERVVIFLSSSKILWITLVLTNGGKTRIECSEQSVVEREE